jgi:DNA-binding response OmpR family regulator
MSTPRRHVLCIDDDRDTAGLIAEELVDRGFKVSMAYDGEQGFQAILAKQPDIVLSDIACPCCPGSICWSGWSASRRASVRCPSSI